MRVPTMTLALALTGCAIDEPTAPVGEGTEIGDEGSGLCSESMAPADGGTAIDALGGTPESLLADTCGAFSGDATLSLTATQTDMVWVDNEPIVYDDYVPDTEPECVDFLYVPLEISMAADELELWSRVADMSFTDTGAVRFTAAALAHQGDIAEDPSDDEGGSDGDSGSYWADNTRLTTILAPTTFAVEDMFTVLMEVDGVWEDESWELTVSWVAESYPEGPDGTVSSYEEVAWTGVVEAK